MYTTELTPTKLAHRELHAHVIYPILCNRHPQTMEWELPPENNPEDENPIVWPTLPTTLWNHMAMGIESVPSDKMFVFGGQKSPREFSNQVRRRAALRRALQ